MSTLQLREVGALVLPAASIARTAKVCEPWARPDSDRGLVQVVKAEPSREQLKRSPASEPAKVKLAEVDEEIRRPRRDGRLGRRHVVHRPGVVVELLC